MSDDTLTSRLDEARGAVGGEFDVLKWIDEEQCIAEGRSRAVYLGLSRFTGRLYALKTLAPDVEASSLAREADELRREAGISLRVRLLGCHPNIAPCERYFEHEGMPVLVSEYAPAGTLRDLITLLEPGSEAAVMATLRLGLEIAHAMLFLDTRMGEIEGTDEETFKRAMMNDLGRLQFGRGMFSEDVLSFVHRDIKPENILIGLDGSARLMDFGQAAFRPEDRPPGRGTSFYQHRTMQVARWIQAGFKPDPRSHRPLDMMLPLFSKRRSDGTLADRNHPIADYYSLGVVAYEMLSGEVPYPRKLTPELFERLEAEHGDLHEGWSEDVGPREAYPLCRVVLEREPKPFCVEGVPPRLEAIVNALVSQGSDPFPATAIPQDCLPGMHQSYWTWSSIFDAFAAAWQDVQHQPAPWPTINPETFSDRRPALQSLWELGAHEEIWRHVLHIEGWKDTGGAAPSGRAKIAQLVNGMRVRFALSPCEDPQYWCARGGFAAADGQWEEAMRCYAKALALDMGCDEAKRSLERIRSRQQPELPEGGTPDPARLFESGCTLIAIGLRETAARLWRGMDTASLLGKWAAWLIAAARPSEGAAEAPLAAVPEEMLQGNEWLALAHACRSSGIQVPTGAGRLRLVQDVGSGKGLGV